MNDRRHTDTELYFASLCQEASSALTIILAHAQLAASTHSSRSHNRHLTTIAETSARLADFIATIEDFRRVQRGQLVLHPTTFSLSDALTPVLQSIYPKAAGRQLHLQIHFTNAIPSVTADLQRFQQIVRHLLSNAVAFTSAMGRVDVTCTALSQADRAHSVMIAVSDTGVGIPHADLQTLFEPFTQLNPDWLPHGKTRGLSLPLARRLAELHGGSLSARSDGTERGSTFTLTLPLPPTTTA